jgi:hypothetical protein|tara:strand:- start:839 stop:1402 length:564 start_codon:yes stop_codon:yes gene_type:complete
MHTETTESIPLELISLFEESLDDSKNRLPHNYNIESLSSDENLCYSITWDDDNDVIAGSVARTRDFYNGGARILSRYYTSKKLDKHRSGLRIHKFHKNGMSTFACDMADQQVDFAIERGIMKHFISREYGNFKVMKNIHKGLNANCKHKDWVLEPNEWQTAPCEGDECWQHIIWRGENPLTNDYRKV